MGLMMCDGKFVSRDEIALVPTPSGTESWKPVPHMEVVDAVTDVVKAHNWQILDENFGLAREGQKMFGVMRINKSNSSDSISILTNPVSPNIVNISRLLKCPACQGRQSALRPALYRKRPEERKSPSQERLSSAAVFRLLP